PIRGCLCLHGSSPGRHRRDGCGSSRDLHGHPGLNRTIVKGAGARLRGRDSVSCSLSRTPLLEGSEQAKKLEGAPGVFLDLNFEDGRVLELHFVPEAIKKFDLHFCLVDFSAGKIEEIGFNTDLVISKSRFAPDVRYRIIDGISQPSSGYIDADFGELLFDRSQVQSGNGMLAASPHSRHDGSAERKGPAQKPSGRVNPPRHQKLPDAGARDPFAAHLDEGHDLEMKSLLASEFAQNLCISRLPVAEAEVRPNVHRGDPQGLHKNLSHKFQRGKMGEFAREGQDEQEVNPLPFDQLNLAVKRGEQFRRILGRKEFYRVRFEGYGRRHSTQRPRRLNYSLEQLLVSKVHPVEVANGQATLLKRLAELTQITHHSHRGFNAS